MGKADWLIARPIAHRGFHDRGAGRVENTLAAAEAAIARKFAIECDLQVTADNVPVVFHDRTLERLTDAKGEVRAKTLAELKTVRLKDTTDRIPTLAELLEAVAGRVPLVIELKSRWDSDRRLEERVAPLLKAYRGPAAVMSFDPDSMVAMRRLLPSLPRGLVADRFRNDGEGGHLPAKRRFTLRHLFATADVGPAFISYGLVALPAPAPLLLHRLGMTLIAWTVRSRADLAKAHKYVDQITFEGFDPEAT